MAKSRWGRKFKHERLQAQAKRARSSGPMRSRCKPKAPQRALAKFLRRGKWRYLFPR
jgi:hypothetical protein